MGEEEGTVRLGLRLPTSLHHRLQEQARENHRSLNSEIVAVLNHGLEAEQKSEERFKTLGARIEEMQIDVQRLKEGLLPRLPAGTMDLIENAYLVAASRGKTLADLLPEALRKVVNEEEPK